MDDYDETVGGKPIRLPKKAAKVKNKAPAALQITAEQLLREAKERDLEIAAPPPKTKISDPEELGEYQRKRRKEFEDNIRKNRSQIANWVKYAKWEENIGEIQRSRSIFERALAVDHRSITLWLQYAELEMRNKQIMHARNIWDRAVTILPRAIQFWLKYSYMEELIGNIPGARQVFERWMQWEPSEQAWQTFINFELRYKEVERARSIWQRFLHVHGFSSKNWIRYARFEEKLGLIQNARIIFERGVEYFGEENLDDVLLIAFAQFEERQKEHQRARVIYRYGLDRLPADRTEEIYKHYTLHEKKYGEKAGIEEAIVSKRKVRYEKQITENAFNYDAWFDYIRLLQNENVSRNDMEDVFERAIAKVPPQREKRYWKRYIYLWINYALYEELDVGDIEITRAVYKTCLSIIPHKKFTFSKIWIMFAHFEVRQMNLENARKILGHAIGMCPRDKLFRSYIDLEVQLREFDRCRILYGKFLEYCPENATTWIKFAELELLLGDIDRARGIFDLSIQRSALDMPEIVWKSYIDFEIEQKEYKRVRQLYENLLEKTNHLKVWLSLVEFEIQYGDEESVREVYKRASKCLVNNSKQERLALLESWLQFENNYGNDESIAKVNQLMPKRIKKRRQVETEDGLDGGWEEYFDYIFPGDQASESNLRVLEAALKWKMRESVIEKDVEGKDDEENAEKHREGDSDTDLSSSSDSDSSD